MKPPTYRDHLLAAHARYVDGVEADGRGALTLTEYRNRQNMKRWRERYQSLVAECAGATDGAVLHENATAPAAGHHPTVSPTAAGAEAC